MEEMLGNIAGARQVFERWMEWEPEEQAWHSYINLEMRFKELERARGIYERFVYVHPEVKNWIKYAKFEEKHGNIGGCFWYLLILYIKFSFSYENAIFVSLGRVVSLRISPSGKNLYTNQKLSSFPIVYIMCIVKSREIFERAVEFFGEENMDEKLFVAFSRFEESCKEVHPSYISSTIIIVHIMIIF